MLKHLYFTDVTQGTEIPSLVKGPVHLMDLVKYAGASGDFTEIHYDDAAAQRNGMPHTILHGMLKTAFLAQMVTQWIGEEGTLKSIEGQYRGLDFVDETITCKGVVTKTETVEGQNLVHCDIWTENNRGQRTTKGNAVVILPSRA
ncbi:MaoC/PaaZ C-terminal domain-containing protein [Chloroflexota bacterium]